MWNSETFEAFLFCFHYVAFLSFESMFTENVNLKYRHATFHIFVTENRVYILLGECPIYFVNVIYKTNS